MKLKKLLALILAVIMCASVLTVIPTTVSAADESLWQTFYSAEEGGYRSELPATDNSAPDGYERIRVATKKESALVTKEKYDLSETTFVLRDLYFSRTGTDWVNIVFANDQTTGKRQTLTNESNGTLSLFVRNTENEGIKFSIYRSDGGETTIGTFASDTKEFEIGLVKYLTSSGEFKWRVRVNNAYTSGKSTDTSYKIASAFGASSTGSYISICANSNLTFHASCKFFNNDETTNRWVARSGKLYTADDVLVTDVTATSLRAKADNTVTSLSRYDMVENDFTISNAKVSTTNSDNNGYRTAFVFSKYRQENHNTTSNNCMSSADKIQIFVRPYLEEVDGVKTTTKLIVSLSTNIAADVKVPVANDYKFRFVLEDDRYEMYINDTRITNVGSASYVSTFANAVNDFCTTGSGINCYITVYSNTYFSGDYKVSTKPEFVDDSLWKTFNSKVDGGVRATVPETDAAAPEGYERIAVNNNVNSTLITKEKYDLTETTIVLNDLYFSKTGTDWVNIVFANDKTTGKRQTKTDEANGTLSLFVRKADSGSIKFTVYTSAGGEIELGTFASASEYEIGFVKIYTSSNEYRWRLRINNTYSSATSTTDIYKIVNTFGPNSKGSYISISANSNITSFRANVKFLNNDDTTNRWVARSGKLYNNDDTAATNNAATSLRAKDGNTISSLSRYNMLENTFSVSNAVVSTANHENNAYRTKIVFSRYRDDNFNTSANNCMSSADKVQVLLRPYVEVIDGKNVTTYLKVSLSTNIENDAMVPVASEYRFRFRLVDGTYQMYINDTRLTYTGSEVKYFKTFANAVNSFCTSGSGTNCYITVSTNTTFRGDFKVTKNSEFVATVDEPMYRCLDFEDFTVNYEGGAVINGAEYNSGAALDVAGNHEIIYPENGIRYKRTLALYRMGDLNSDNTINVLDYIAMTKALAKTYELSAAGEKAADLTQDKELHANDLVALRKKLLGVDNFVDTNTDTVGNISAVSPSNNQTVKVANDAVYYWAQNYTIRSSAPYYGSGKIFQCKPVVFKWTADGDASSYVLKISTNKSFEDAIEIVTTNNSASVNNLFAGETYYWQVTAGDSVSSVYSFKTAVSPRTIALDGVDNTRDIGGYVTESGKRVKQGMIYRTASLDNITEAGKLAAINEYKIKTDVDLRAEGDGTAGKGSPIGESVNYYQYSGSYYISSTTGINAQDRWPNIAAAIKVFAKAENYPIAIHCSIGRDRTGTMCLLINGLLGVSKEDLFMDYELTYFSKIGCSDEVGANGMVDMFERTYNWLAEYGGEDDRPFSEHVEKYMLDIGVTPEEIEAIRTNMLEQ